MAERLGGLFGDYTLDVFEECHHFDPPHRAEPERLAARLLKVWERVPANPGMRILAVPPAWEQTQEEGRHGSLPP
jgi:hypothetical protein